MNLKEIKKLSAETWVWIKSFLSDEKGASTVRLLNIVWLSVLCFNLTVCTLYSSFVNHEPKLPPIESTSGYVLITSALLAAKLGQGIWVEKPTNVGTSPDPNPPVSPPK